jgi:hypothetical protein
MKPAPHSFTQCAHCQYARPVEQMEKDGRLSASREVGYCEMFAQYRALRFIRTCADFKRVQEAA